MTKNTKQKNKKKCPICGKEFINLSSHMKKHNKEEKDVKKKSSNGLSTATFLDKSGKKIKLTDVISKEDCWELKKKNDIVQIMTHNAIKRIANIAGISKNFDVAESENIDPSYKNELEYIVRVTIHCLAIDAKDKKGCIHDNERDLTITGEANRISTPHRGRGYLRKMAEKRAFDIAVLEHLGLYSSVFSEEEAADFERKREPSILPGMKNFEEIVPEINAILNAKDIERLKMVGKKIKSGVKIEKYSDMQIKYLRELYQSEYGKKNTSF